MRQLTTILSIGILMLCGVVFAQDDDSNLQSAQQEAPELTLPVNPNLVSTIAEDGKSIFADFFLLDPNRPSVILVHELYLNRLSWLDLTKHLLHAGFNVLAVDLRGYGATRGRINWNQSVDDMRIWFEWLRDQGMRPDAISIIGSSIGSSLAIVGCGNDEFCRTAIGISPSRSYYGIPIVPTLNTTMADRPVFVTYAERDRFPASRMPGVLEELDRDIHVITYSGNKHGMALLSAEFESLWGHIHEWLTIYGG